ncbi:MAG: GldL-related protein [Flavobacteriaceae bacterium]
MIERIKYLGLSFSVFGCLFKLMSWMGAHYLLILGLSLLGIYFLIKVFKKNM